MAQTYTRQSSFADGDTITAALFNNEYNQLVNAFAYSSSSASSTGHRHDGTAGQGGNIHTIGDLDFLNKIVVDDSNNRWGFYVEVSSSAVEQIRLSDGVLTPVADSDIDLGTSLVYFKNAYIDAITTTGNVSVGGNLDVTGTIDFSDSAITNVGSIQLDSIAGDADDNTSIAFSGSDVITMTTGGTAALTIDASQNVTIAGDLTVSGDDITMATNTAGNLLIADGTNFNSVAVGSLSEISTVANDDVFLAVDTSGGGLKKITRSAVVAGLATSSAISNLAEDSTPQLGGDLDVNGNDIVSVSNGNINLLPNGSGKVIMDGNGSSGGITITDGNIDIRTGTGAVSKVKFYCESSNAHAQTLQAQPHSASSSAVLTLPVATGTLVGSGDSGTVTNGMLAGSIADSKLSTISTAGKVDIGALEIDGATDIGADLADADLIIVDDGGGGTERKSAMSRIPTYVFSKVSGDATVASNGALTIASDAVEQSMIADDAVGADQLAASAVVTASIVDDNVTQAKIADDAVGADQLAANAVVNASVASGAAIADTKLATISTAGKVALTALEIDGGSDIGADLTTSDLIIVDDGAGGTNKKAALSRVVTLMSAQGFSTEDPTALAIALG